MGALTLEVESRADRDLSGVWVEILLPQGSDGLLPELDGVPVSYSTTTFGMRVPVRSLKAGETHRIRLRPRGSAANH
jgi:hypothetical protein